MKIAILAPVHIYDDIRVFRKEATTLASDGNEVILFARTPDNKPLTRNGVSVIPVAPYRRLRRFASLVPLGIRAARQRADVYHLHNPDTLPIGFALHAIGKTVIYDTHEDFATEILLRQWIPAPIRTVAASGVTRLEALAGRTLAAVIVTQEQLLDRIPGALVIGNPPLLDVGKSRALAAARSAALPDRTTAPLTLGYIGGLSKDRGLFAMLDLLKELNAISPTKLVLAGPSVNDDALEQAQARPEWQWVDYLGALPQEEAFEAMSESDIGLILFENTASHRFIDPNKIYEYLSLALPFAATGFPGWRDRFSGHDVGLFLDPETPVSERAARVHAYTTDRGLLIEKGRRGIEYLASHYSWQQCGAPRLLKLYRGMNRAKKHVRSPRGSGSTDRPIS